MPRHQRKTTIMNTLSLRLRPLAAAILCSLIAPALFAQTATTDPVGFITDAVGGGGTVAVPKISLISPTLMQPVAWQGLGTITTNLVTVSGTPWTANQFNGANGKYFVEIVSGTNAGAWTDVVTTTTNTVTTFDNLAPFASASDTIRIRKHLTLADFLGATNSAGFKGGTSVADADEILIYDGSTFVVYWYYDASDNAGPAGWYDTNYNPGGGALIAPHQGVVVRRKASGAVSVISMGTVKTGNTFLPVRPGINVLGTVSAKGLTLATSNLYTGLTATGMKGSASPATADELIVYTATGHTNYFYYDASDNAGPAGWYDVDFNPAGTVPIVPGSAMVVNRKNPSATFNWVLPSPSTF